MPKFFTLPPIEIPYPYILISAHRPEPGLRYLARWRQFVEAVIIDSGVELFRDPTVKDYPGGPQRWIERLVGLYERVKSIVPDAEVVATVPDYCDDYHPGGLWESWERTNVERTLDNIEYVLERHGDVDWLVPVQGHYEDPFSIVSSLAVLEAVGALDYAERVCRATELVPCLAIANLCVSKSCTTVERTVAYASAWLRASPLAFSRPKRPYRVRVHVFGVSALCMKRIKHDIHSWDSTAWTKPRAPHGSSAWSNGERVYLFLTFLHRYPDLIELPPHPKPMRARVAVRC